MKSHSSDDNNWRRITKNLSPKIGRKKFLAKISLCCEMIFNSGEGDNYRVGIKRDAKRGIKFIGILTLQMSLINVV